MVDHFDLLLAIDVRSYVLTLWHKPRRCKSLGHGSGAASDCQSRRLIQQRRLVEMSRNTRSVKGLSATSAYPLSQYARSQMSTYHAARRPQRLNSSTAAQASRQLLRIMLAISLCLCLLGYSVWPPAPMRGSSSVLSVAADHHIEPSMLVMTLDRSQSTDPSVRVTVTNYHHSTSLSLLTWDTPFDDAAVSQGVFTILDHETEKEIKSPSFKIDRLLAPKKDDFLELLPRHAIAKDVPIKSPGLSFEPGRNYDVQVKGRWRAIWHADIKDSSEQVLRMAGGLSGLIDWHYQSNVLKLHIW